MTRKPTNGCPTNSEEIKALAEDLRRPATTLIALGRSNDPFYVTPTRRAEAKWFAALWKKFKVQKGVHLRRLHYLFVSQRTPIEMRDGMVYANTEPCWIRLAKASKDARYLNLVSADDFVDRRNDDPIINTQNTGLPTSFVYGGDDTTIPPEMPSLPSAHLVRSRPRTQYYQIEIWAEKTTMNDVLEPLAEKYGAHLITGAGEISATHCNLCVQRAAEDDDQRPVRILYISDFDPGGMSMPVAAARKIEWFIHASGLDLDVQLRPIVLTHEQCEQYRLPRTPIKEGELRADAFEKRFGEGATELDALEALHPGVLAQIVEREIGRYYDYDLDADTEAAVRPINAKLAALTANVHRRHAKKIKLLRAEYAQIVRVHAGWMKRANVVRHAIEKSLNDEAPAIVAEANWPEPEDGDEDDNPLFDSTRDYVEQIDCYKAFQGKPTERGAYGTSSRATGSRTRKNGEGER